MTHFAEIPVSRIALLQRACGRFVSYMQGRTGLLHVYSHIARDEPQRTGDAQGVFLRPEMPKDRYAKIGMRTL